jgi:NAD(P)-dependent dehydrogenase (short-subunit alcohol dehydrogenase family)
VERVQNSIPLQRLGNPDLIAQTVLYLLHNPFITGEIITVDGGERLK